MRKPCGSTRCTCDHEACDLGWIATYQLDATGRPQEAQRKCEACFPMATVTTLPTRTGHPQQTNGEGGYPDARSAAAGDR